MALHPTALDGEIVEVTDTVLHGVLLRTWQGDTILSDVRITPDVARNIAASLLHAAQKLDGERVSFKWHASDCSPAHQANGLCRCSGLRQPQPAPAMFTVVGSGVVTV